VEPAQTGRAASILVVHPGGSFIESPNTLGYSHLAEHLLGSFCSRFLPDADANERHVDSLGAYWNATTDMHCASYHVTCREETLGSITRLLRPWLLAPRIDDGRVVVEKSAVLHEMRGWLDDPLYLPLSAAAELRRLGIGKCVERPHEQATSSTLRMEGPPTPVGSCRGLLRFVGNYRAGTCAKVPVRRLPCFHPTEINANLGDGFGQLSAWEASLSASM
jgi:hypothetical protein